MNLLNKIREDARLAKSAKQAPKPATTNKASAANEYLLKLLSKNKQRKAINRQIKKNFINRTNAAINTHITTTGNKMTMRRIVITTDYNKNNIGKKFNLASHIETDEAIRALTYSSKINDGRHTSERRTKTGRQYTFFIHAPNRELRAIQKRILELVNSYDYTTNARSTSLEDTIDKPVVPINLRLHKDSTALLQSIDIGGGRIVSNIGLPGLCVPETIFNALTENNTVPVYLGSNQYSGKLTLKHIVASIMSHRPNNDTDILDGCTIDEMIEECKRRKCKYVQVFERYKMRLIAEYKHPDFESKKTRLKPGVVCIVNSNHITNFSKPIESGHRLNEERPRLSKYKDWQGAPSKLVQNLIPYFYIKMPDSLGGDMRLVQDIPILMPDGSIFCNNRYDVMKPCDRAILYSDLTQDKEIFYTTKPIHNFALSIMSKGIHPQIMQLDPNQNITCFSVGNNMIKYTPDYHVVGKWVESLKETNPKLGITNTGQSADSLAYSFFEKQVGKSYTSPDFFNLLTGFNGVKFPYCADGPLRFAHIFITPEFNEADLKHYQGVDECKSYYNAMRTMPYGRFTLDNDPEPYDNDEIVDVGFYEITCSIGYPTHGPYTYIAGFLLIELMEDQKITRADIRTQIIPTYKHAYGELGKVVDEVYTQLGKAGPNHLNGILSACAKHHTEETFLTQSEQEFLAILKEHEGQIEYNEITIGDTTLYQITSKLYPTPIYCNYLPIHHYTYQYAILNMYKQLKPVLSAVRGIYTDLALMDTRVVDLSDVKPRADDNTIGQFRLEDKIPETRKPYTPFYKEPREAYTPPLWKIYDCTDEKTLPIMFEMIANGMSINLDEEAGKGKSYFTKKLIEYLTANGKRVVITAATGTAASKLHHEAMTTHSGLGIILHSKEQGTNLFNEHIDVFICDEAYFLDQGVNNTLMIRHLRNQGVAIVYVGSTLQLNCDIMMDSECSFMHKLCDGNKVVLTFNHRFANSPALGEYCKQHVAYIRGRGPEPDNNNIGNTDCDLSLTATKNAAITINDYWTEIYSHGKSVWVREILPYPVFEGMYLIAWRKTKKGEEIYNNGQCYTIIEVREGSVILAKTNENRILNEPIELVEMTDAQVNKKLLRGYAYTVHRAQGANFTIPYTVYEYKKALHFAKKNKTWRPWHYVACSRSNDINNLNICDELPCPSDTTEKAFIYKITHTQTGWFYIGSTKDYDKRMEEHSRADQNCKFHEYIRNYGWAEFTCEKLDTFGDIPDSELKIYEHNYIEELQPYFNELNA